MLHTNQELALGRGRIGRRGNVQDLSAEGRQQHRRLELAIVQLLHQVHVLRRRGRREADGGQRDTWAGGPTTVQAWVTCSNNC